VYEVGRMGKELNPSSQQYDKIKIKKNTKRRSHMNLQTILSHSEKKKILEKCSLKK